MTANRWWVRLAARWLARVDGVSGQLRLVMLAVTGASTASLTLQSYGYGHLAGPFIAVSAVLCLLFAYFYSEGGVWNQMAKDRTHMSSNYPTPQQVIGTQMQTRALIAALQSEALDDEQREVVETAIKETYEEYADGMELERD